jgi:hypothetical protein
MGAAHRRRKGKVITAVYDNGVKLPFYCDYADRERLEAANIPPGAWGLCPTAIRVGNVRVDLAYEDEEKD